MTQVVTAPNKAVIKLPWPHRDLSPNARVHWAQRSRAAKKARHDAASCALAAGVRHIDASSLSVTATFHPPDDRPRDLDNMLASSKPMLDGIADVTGVDDSRWSISIRRGDKVKHGEIRLDLEVVS